MIVKTKFDLGESVWHLTNFAQKIVETEIVAITIHVRKHGSRDIRIIYLGKDGHRATETGFYKTKKLATDSYVDGR